MALANSVSDTGPTIGGASAPEGTGGNDGSAGAAVPEVLAGAAGAVSGFEHPVAPISRAAAASPAAVLVNGI
ncbi:hypothetical protein MFAL_36990 [Mycolicibacterium fallax]|nr:hypothetical protein MFAL_36990 [Mycolicibacterium fallax]